MASVQQANEAAGEGTEGQSCDHGAVSGRCPGGCLGGRASSRELSRPHHMRISWRALMIWWEGRQSSGVKNRELQMCMSIISCWSSLLITGISEVGGGWGDLGLRLGGKAAEMRLPKPVALGNCHLFQHSAAPRRHVLHIARSV
jgi:hypothetical protein